MKEGEKERWVTGEGLVSSGLREDGVHRRRRERVRKGSGGGLGEGVWVKGVARGKDMAKWVRLVVISRTGKGREGKGEEKCGERKALVFVTCNGRREGREE